MRHPALTRQSNNFLPARSDVIAPAFNIICNANSVYVPLCQLLIPHRDSLTCEAASRAGLPR